jgi:Tfp pilus assembly protein PilV
MMAADDMRDLFASLAMAGIMAKTASTTMPAGTREALAKLAYQMADAMLAAREKVEVVQ